nr:uncharacterized protein LOC117977895 isoform X1 [Pan paniscus]
MEKGNLGPGVRIQCNSGFLLSFHELPIPTGCLEELLKAAECPAAGHFQSRGRPSKRGDGWESADILCEATIWSWTRVHVTLCHSGNLDYHTNESIQMLASGAESQDRRRSETTVNWTALGSTDEEIQHRFVLQCLAAFSARLATPETPGGQRQACHLHHCITTTQHYRGTCPDNQNDGSSPYGGPAHDANDGPSCSWDDASGTCSWNEAAHGRPHACDAWVPNDKTSCPSHDGAQSAQNDSTRQIRIEGRPHCISVVLLLLLLCFFCL